MLKTLKLILPVIVPSWNFFDDITASPRLEVTILNSSQDKGEDWQAFYQKPRSLNTLESIKRLFWNPQWNQSLWGVSCAEQFIMTEDENRRIEIQAEMIDRIRLEIFRRHIAFEGFFKFRLVLVEREDGHSKNLQRDVVFTSSLYAVKMETMR